MVGPIIVAAVVVFILIMFFLVCSGGTVDFIDGIRSAGWHFYTDWYAFKTCCPGKNYSSAD